jgi:Xaa-Pro aminopeptidase
VNDDNLLMVGDSASNADLLYVAGVCLPGSFVYFRHHGRNHIVVGEPELDRARRHARGCRVLSHAHCLRLLRERARRPTLPNLIHLLARRRNIRKFVVPESFPLGLARQLRRLKLRLKVRSGPVFFPERAAKAGDELKKINAALIMAEVGMAEAIQAIRQAKITPRGRLLHRGLPLTSERLRAIVEVAILQAGGSASRTIVAGSRQSSDPLEEGSGPLLAHQPIILDIFPRSQKTGYFADITRTVVRGRASEALRRLYHTVAAAQHLALGLLRPGVRARDVHQTVLDFFARQGYRTGRLDGRSAGFLHATGHGVGLQHHEPPLVDATSEATLAANHIVTVEPGLYYPDLGGVRLEDLALLTRSGARNLTKFEKVLEV